MEEFFFVLVTPVRVVLIHDIKEEEGERQKEVQEAKSDEERESEVDGEVIRGPLLDQGFIDVGFSSFCDVVAVGPITCERVVLGKGAKVLIGGSAQGICQPHPER